MSENTLIKIEPSILIWARTSLGLTVDDVAKKMGKKAEHVLAWESGENVPTYVQLEKLAYEIYKRPIALFFMQQPPNDESLKKDFRTLSTQDIDSVPSDVRIIVRKVKSHQLSLEELFDGVNPSTSQLIKKVSLKVGNRDKTKVAFVRSALNLDHGIDATANQEEFFTFCRTALAKVGVFVFQYPIGDLSIRGFCLYHKEFPAIVSNSKDAVSAKLFTIFHELCHLLCHEGSIYIEDANSQQKIDQDKDVEAFCNWFAAELLLPDAIIVENSKLINSIQEHPQVSEYTLIDYAKFYKISTEVLLRKLVDMGYVQPSYYAQMRAIWVARWQKQQEQKKENAKGGPTHFQTRVSQMGKPYVQAILDNYYSGRIGVYEAAGFLNTKIKNISGFSEIIYRQ